MFACASTPMFWEWKFPLQQSGSKLQVSWPFWLLGKVKQIGKIKLNFSEMSHEQKNID